MAFIGVRAHTSDQASSAGRGRGAVRVVALLRSQAAGAAIAQIWQALTTFGLQAIAAAALGASGLGTFSLCLGVIVLATAVVSGMVGDSLVILDRHDPEVRGGLFGWTLLLSVLGAAVAALVMAATQALRPAEAALFGAALAAFVLESLLRRLFMAVLRFWRLVLIDGVGLVVSMTLLLAVARLSQVSLAAFFASLLLGQVVAVAVGLALLDVRERQVAAPTRRGFVVVARLGLWRGAQVSIPPLVLTLVRLVVIAAIGTVALGSLEAARIFAAPALLVVQGFGSYLLSVYVRDRGVGLEALTRRASRTSVWMTGAAVLLAGALALMSGPLGALALHSSLSINPWTVFGWGLYVAGTATCQPFASLAAVHGHQVKVFLCRCGDAAAALIGLSLLAVVEPGHLAVWTPYILAAGLVLGGGLVRRLILRPAVQRRRSLPTPARAA